VILGVVENPYARNVPSTLKAAAGRLGIEARLIDLPSVTVDFQSAGEASVTDRHGEIRVDAVAPYLLFGFPAAIHALKALSWFARMQNPVDGVLLSDDKAATAERLAHDGIAQVPTRVLALDLELARAAAGRTGYPVVLKRTHGAQGRWVRRAADGAALEKAFGELAAEGHGALVLQPEVVECDGSSVRIIVTGGKMLVATERVASDGEFRSNVAAGASQAPTGLSPLELELAERATAILGLKHAGVDLLRTRNGPQVLEVNGCPDFTSMEPYFDFSLAESVISASI
jgi:ribosomal protein S6--L-glutamate ligase